MRGSVLIKPVQFVLANEQWGITYKNSLKTLRNERLLSDVKLISVLETVIL